MGMYTALHFNAELKETTPDDVVSILRYMVGAIDEPEKTPDHPLFGDTRWHYMLTCGSAYFPMQSASRVVRLFDRWHVNVNSNFKNYDDEVSKFVDWIMPYVESGAGDGYRFLGYSLYEEASAPELIYMPGDENDPPNRKGG